MTTIRTVAAERFGEACLDALLEAVAGHERPAVGLPTGNTPGPLYEALRGAAEAGRVDVSAWRAFAIDEYGGPRYHPCSNRAFFERHWDVIPGAPRVEQFDPEATDIAEEVRRMAGAITRAGGLTVSLLGIGLNGHLAFNEPGSAAESAARRMELHPDSRESARRCWGDATPTWGLTLGLRELLGAARVVVMANGLAKAAVVARAIQGAEAADCPASLVRRAPSATWVCDEAAASGLGRG